MKKILIIILILIGAYLFKVPEYRELNDIAIIEGIAVDYDGYNYKLYLREVIPIKGDQGIDYEYKYYEGVSSSLEDSYEEVLSNTKKKLYLKRCKFLVTNMYSSDDIIDIFNIKPKTIYHDTKEVYETLKKL